MTMKYTYEFKRQIVDDYLAHRGGVLALAKKYGVPAKSLVRQWIAAYRESGDAGLKASWTKEAYSEEFKRKAVERYLSSPDSYETLAAKMHLRNPATLNRWVREYQSQGMGAWKPKKRGRPRKETKKVKPVSAAYERGRKEADARYSKLIQILMSQERMEDIGKIAQDEAYRKELYQKFRL